MFKKALLFVAAFSVVCSPVVRAEDPVLMGLGAASTVGAMESLIRYLSDKVDRDRLKKMNSWGFSRVWQRAVPDFPIGLAREASQTILPVVTTIMGVETASRGRENSMAGKALVGASLATLALQLVDWGNRLRTMPAFNAAGDRRKRYNLAMKNLSEEEEEEFARIQSKLINLSRLRTLAQIGGGIGGGVGMMALGAKDGSHSGEAYLEKMNQDGAVKAGLLGGMLSLSAMRLLSIMYRNEYRAWVNRMIKKGEKIEKRKRRERKRLRREQRLAAQLAAQQEEEEYEDDEPEEQEVVVDHEEADVEYDAEDDGDNDEEDED